MLFKSFAKTASIDGHTVVRGKRTRKRTVSRSAFADSNALRPTTANPMKRFVQCAHTFVNGHDGGDGHIDGTTEKGSHILLHHII